MSALNSTLIVSVLASLCIGGAVGASVVKITMQVPACATAPAPPQGLRTSPPLDDTGKTYR